MSARVIVIDECLHTERAGYVRAFYADSPDAAAMVTVIGYCSPGGSHRTIRACATEVRRYDRTTPIYRHGRKLAY